jgi:predicted nucleic acid-binding protein
MLDMVDRHTYDMTMTRRTSLNLDFDLVEEAKGILDTRETTETIHRALSEVVRQARLQRLTRRRFDFRDADLADLRRSRTEESAPVSVSPRVPA